MDEFWTCVLALKPIFAFGGLLILAGCAYGLNQPPSTTN
jgi:hypothetical protein